MKRPGIAVLKANVNGNKTYDVVVDVSPGWSMPAILLSPVAKGSDRRSVIPKFERREKSVSSGLQRTADFDKYHQKQQARIADVKKDFIGGGKSEKVRNLNADDCR